MLKNTTTTYGSLAKTFHWVIFLLVFFMILLGYFMDDVSEANHAMVVNIHKLTGLSILILMLLRLCWALLNPKPVVMNATRFEKFLEHSGHFLLYAVLIAMPAVGWLMTGFSGKVPHLFGFYFKLPLAVNKPLAHLCGSIHNFLAIVIIALVSLHVLAAFYHFIIKKDDVLQRMLP